MQSALEHFKTVYLEHPLFLVGLLLIFGYYLGILFRVIRMPEITGFILAGILVNSFTTGLVSEHLNHSLHVVTETAIGLLALSVGAEFSRAKMRRIAPRIFIITLVGLLVTFSAVLLACIGYQSLVPDMPVGFPYAILLAVVACAAAPAMILAEVHHLRAHGRFVDYLFGIVALGDAFSVLIFGLAFTVVTNILQIEGSTLYTLKTSLREILMSILAGAAGGVVLHLLARKVKNRGEQMIIVIGVAFILTGMAIVLHLSPLIVNMIVGAVLVNLSQHNHRLLQQIEPMTPPIYALFFVIAGLELDPGIFTQGPVMLAGAFYIIVRGISRHGGIILGSWLCGLPTAIRRHLGMCMFSQGGIALGFVLLIRTSPQAEQMLATGDGTSAFAIMVNIILISIFVNEIASPFFLRYGIIHGNEMERP